MNVKAAPSCGLYFINDGEKPYLTVEFGHTDDGVLAVNLTTVPVARQEPIRVALDGATLVEHNLPAAEKTCDCPEDAQSVLGGVHVRHSEGCIFGEPCQYAWNDQGSLYTGSLADYADQWLDRINYDDHGTDAAAVLHTVTEATTRSWPVTVTFIEMDDSVQLHYRLSVGPEWVSVIVDGRVV
ncbi:hypothetical protein [Nocardia sp. NPDC052566]|uniref:hypothetical protein n=1 Tax=Nocardia sp. NPDC052566 TaxID=3364330 RepID=UPI0037CA58F7